MSQSLRVAGRTSVASWLKPAKSMKNQRIAFHRNTGVISTDGFVVVVPQVRLNARLATSNAAPQQQLLIFLRCCRVPCPVRQLNIHNRSICNTRKPTLMIGSELPSGGSWNDTYGKRWELYRAAFSNLEISNGQLDSEANDHPLQVTVAIRMLSRHTRFHPPF